MRVRPIPMYAVEPIGIMTYSMGALTDPDNQKVYIQVNNTDNNTVIVPSGTLTTYEGVGTYQYTFNSNQTAIEGNYAANYSYTISGSPRQYTENFIITGQMPYWSGLDIPTREMVTGIVHRLDKSFDSTAGGPYLQEMQQSGFLIYEEVSMVMTDETMDYINFTYQPIFNPAYQIGLNAQVPFPTTYNGVLRSQTYANFLKHIARNYIEQPTPEGMNAAWMNRRDYYQRWWQLYLFEKEIADLQLRKMKRDFMVGSHRAMLVAGGLIPRMFVNPARPHFSYSAVNMGGV